MCFRPPTVEMADTKCPACGFENLMGARKCKQCGAEMANKVAGTSAPGVHEATNTMAAPGAPIAPAAPSAPAVPRA